MELGLWMLSSDRLGSESSCSTTGNLSDLDELLHLSNTVSSSLKQDNNGIYLQGLM